MRAVLFLKSIVRAHQRRLKDGRIIQVRQYANKRVKEEVPSGKAGGSGPSSSDEQAPLLAPNGEPSKLNRLQWHQVRTPEFKAWFGDWENDPESASKVVDENGEPLVVLHGTAGDFSEFDKKHAGKNFKQIGYKHGFFFTNIARIADITKWDIPDDTGANIMPVFIQAKKPLIVEINNATKIPGYWGSVINPDIYFDNRRKLLYDRVKSSRKDSLIIRNREIGEALIVAFSPTQIKSAIANSGTFDPSAADITKSITLVMPSGNRYRLGPDQYVFEYLMKALGPGERWITVHAGGDKSAKGQPVLVRETQHGSGVYHVIGGAGGRLNYLKLRGLKPQESYKQQIAERQAAKRQERKVQRERDKEAGLTQAKKEATAAVVSQKREGQRAFVRAVAEKLGWDQKQIEPEIPENLSDKAKQRFAEQHHAALLKRAHEAVDLQRTRLVSDADARLAAQVGELPLHTDDPATLSVADLDDRAPPSSGLGFATQYSKRAGLSEDELRAEVEEQRGEVPEEKRKAAIARGETAQLIRSELSGLQDQINPDVGKKLVDAREAMELLREQKKLRAMEQRAREAQQDIETAAETPHAYNLEVGAEDESLDEKVMQDIENELRTVKTRTFLQEAGKAKEIEPHVATGAFNSINALALAAGGSALVDRSVVDVLGVAGAAQVLARRLHADLPDDIARITEGMQAFHADDYLRHAESALKQAHELQQQAEALNLGEVQTGDEFESALSAHRARDAALAESNRVLGVALGEMEANAALVKALQDGPSDRLLEVPLGKMSLDNAVIRARAIGLQRGDYKIDTIGGQQVLTVTPAGLDRLAQPIDRESVQQVRRNLDIISGKYDEDDWLPGGIADRPDLGMDLKPGVVQRIAEPFHVEQGDVEGALRRYIGGRKADGDSANDILADIQSADFVERAGVPLDRYLTALDAVAPTKAEGGKKLRASALADRFEQYADVVAGNRSTLNRQRIDVNSKVAAECVHRALAAQPAGVAAYKPIGELTGDDQRALREYFYRHVAKEDDAAAELRHHVEELKQAEPEREFEDMFGERGPNPEWADWKARHDELQQKISASGLDWQRYTKAMHGHVHAYAAIQDLIRSETSERFADEYNKLNAHAPIRTGRSIIRHNLNHLDAVDPKAREERARRERELRSSLQERDQGRYSFGSVKSKLNAQREQRDAFEQAQFGMFADDAEPTEQKPLASDERHTLGHVAEGQLAKLITHYGRNFKPGQPVEVGRPTMAGDGIARQRAIKLIEANKRVAIAAGTGSGKTLIQLAGFTHLQTQGKARRALYLVPSIVQGEFHGQATKFLDPTRQYRWHIEPGASREERIAAYKDPSYHFAVMTHQAFRDDMLHLGAQHAGITPDEMSERIDAMTPQQRKVWMQDVMKREGIDFDYLGVDEGHNLLNRAGKQNSSMANVVDALSANTPYYINSTADMVKNDVSEAFDVMAKMAPDHYTDRAAFMRRYANDPAGLKREMARYLYPSKILPKVRADKREVAVELKPEQQKAIADLERHIAKARVSRMAGQTDVDAVRKVAPEAFDGVPEDQHAAVAHAIGKDLGLTKEAAIRNIIDDRAVSAKYDHVSALAKDRKGKPGVVFASRLEVVKHLADRLQKEGHHVITLTGADSAAEKARKTQLFREQGGILVSSDAGATGANLQAGKWLVQYDAPMTAMVHAQRQGRIYRIGQHDDVELIDLVANHAHEKRARERLRDKYELRELMTSPMESLDDTGLGYYLHQRDTARMPW